MKYVTQVCVLGVWTNVYQSNDLVVVDGFYSYINDRSMRIIERVGKSYKLLKSKEPV